MDEYLNMFPQDLLTSNKKVKPIDVRKIEHEDFIDYEIEFVELSEESKEDGSADVAASPAPEHRFTAAGPAGMTLVNFVDLLRRARVRHKAQLSQTLHGDKRKRRRIKVKSTNIVKLKLRNERELFIFLFFLELYNTKPFSWQQPR